MPNHHHHPEHVHNDPVYVDDSGTAYYRGFGTADHNHDTHHHHSDDGTAILIHQHDDTGDIDQHNYHGFDYDRDEHIDIHFGPADHDHDTT